MQASPLYIYPAALLLCCNYPKKNCKAIKLVGYLSWSDCVTEHNNKIMEDDDPQKPKAKDNKNSNHKNQV